MSVVLFVVAGILGFSAGLAIAHAEEARSHPRYLLSGGGAVFLAALIAGSVLNAYPLAYYLVIFVMMLGIGTAAAGWEAEREWDNERAEVRLERMKTLRAQMLSRPVERPSWERPVERPETAGSSDTTAEN